MSRPAEFWLRLTMLESRAREQEMTKADQKWFLKEGRGASLAPLFYFSFKHALGFLPRTLRYHSLRFSSILCPPPLGGD